MKIVFLSIGGLSDLGDSGLYQDLLKFFRDNGHEVYVVSQRERRTKLRTELSLDHGINVLRVKTGNITKANIIEKGISTITIGILYKHAIYQYFSDIKFDLILYATPPVTIAKTVKVLKKRDKAITYLMLKDIFPQNAIDIGMLMQTGLKGMIAHYFFRVEKKLYQTSDFIGCMSEANIRFLKKQNPEIPKEKIELCPNTINPIVKSNLDKSSLRKKYDLPENKIIFVYGGNFGKPQNVNYIIKVLQRILSYKECHFVMSGSGTDFAKIKELKAQEGTENLSVFDNLSRNDYYQLLDGCDVGMLFLDYRFTIPNFPSRLLDYLNHEIPVISATDKNTDVGQIIQDNGFGWWCESSSAEAFESKIIEIIRDKEKLYDMGKIGKEYLKNNFHTRIAYTTIMSKFTQNG